jgi:23S rRNA-/tRNA-specific pseudouridylate synthase
MIHLIHFSIISCLSCHFIINQVFALVSHENSYSVGNHIKNRGTGVLFASQREDEWVLNPETNRLIKPDGPKWREFMCRSGGYIAFDNQLKAIDRKALWTWEQKNVSSTSEISTDHLRNMNTLWNPLSPTSADLDNKVLEEDIETLPFLDQLLFVHKPSSLLTLPGIGSDKQVCLASLVNEWLESDSNDILSAAQASALRFGKKEKKKKKPFVTRPCHRLDYDTSGVLVIGLTRDSLRLTNAMFETSESPKLQKTYVALVAGHVERDTGFINYP